MDHNIYIYIFFFLSLNPILRYRFDVHRNVNVSRLNITVVDTVRESVTGVIAVSELAAIYRPIIALAAIVFGLLFAAMYRQRRRRRTLGRRRHRRHRRRTLSGRLRTGGHRRAMGVRARVVRKVSDGRSPRACKFIRDRRCGTPGHLVSERAFFAFNMGRHDGRAKRRLRVELWHTKRHMVTRQ